MICQQDPLLARKALDWPGDVGTKLTLGLACQLFIEQ